MLFQTKSSLRKSLYLAEQASSGFQWDAHQHLRRAQAAERRVRELETENADLRARMRGQDSRSNWYAYWALVPGQKP